MACSVNVNYFVLSFLTAGTQAGEEMPVVSKTNIKEYKDSFSNEKFDFRNHPNITFFVYVSNFTWPIKIQVGNALLVLYLHRWWHLFREVFIH